MSPKLAQIAITSYIFLTPSTTRATSSLSAASPSWAWRAAPPSPPASPRSWPCSTGRTPPGFARQTTSTTSECCSSCPTTGRRKKTGFLVFFEAFFRLMCAAKTPQTRHLVRYCSSAKSWQKRCRKDRANGAAKGAARR